MNQQITNQSAQTAGYDEAYTWGRSAETYLSQRELVRLTILRSRLDDRHALRRRRATISRPRARAV